MVTFLKSLRRPETEAATAANQRERSIAREYAALEALVVRAEKAAEQLRSLDAVSETAAALEAMHERFAGVESRLSGLEELGARFSGVEEQADRVAKTQARTEVQLSHAAEGVERLQSQLGAVGDKVDTALVLRGELERFLGLEGPMAALRAEADTLRTQLADLADNVARMRGQHDDALRAHRHTLGRLESFDQEHQAASGKLEELERRVQAAEQSLEPVGQAAESIPSVQHQLAVLKTLAEQVTHKTSALEQQREAVDRAATQISQLTRLDRELDVWLRRQEEQMRRFGAIEAKVAEVQALQTKVLARTEELQSSQRHVDEGQQAARQMLTELREQMRNSSESFELENRGLHAVSERVADLRTAVKDCEARFAVLDTASQGAAAVQAQVRTLAEQATELSAEITRLSEEARRIGSLRDEAERLDATAQSVATGMERIRELEPEVGEVTRQLATLRGTRELLADGLEQMRLAAGEMSRLRESHGEVQAWLANADVWTRKVQAQVKDLSALEPVVERIRGDVEVVKNAMVGIETRRALVDEVHQRLDALGNAAATLVERTETLQARMDNAENRFAKLARQADDAQRISESMAAVQSAVGDAETRIGLVGESARALEARAGELDEMEERIRLLGQELEQRQGALDRATEHLARASALRQEAAETAHRLEELARGLAGGVEAAEHRSAGLDRLSGELEARANALKPIDRQLGRFEELLATWEAAQAEAARALEQTVARQAAVEALEAQVKHIFELAESAVQHMQAIGAARREVEDTRRLLEETQSQFRAAEGALQGFEARRRQLERTEQRLARAEALAIDVRATVEALQAQRAVVDHVIERAGALGFQMKQAEALIEALRRERTLAADVKAAVSAVREEDEEAGGSDA
jgi:chromosome segregation ATPase